MEHVFQVFVVVVVFSDLGAGVKVPVTQQLHHAGQRESVLRRNGEDGATEWLQHLLQRPLARFQKVTTGPHIDRMMKLLGDMKQVEGQALPSSLLGQGLNSSDYFRLQGQLKNIPAQPAKRPLPTKAAAAAAAAAPPRARPPSPTSLQEAFQQQADIEKRLDEYEEKAKQAIHRVEVEGHVGEQQKIIGVGSLLKSWLYTT